MAKGRSNRSTRVGNYNANPLRSPSFRPKPRTYNLTNFEDFRRWEPELTDDRYPRRFPQPLSRVSQPITRVFTSGRSLAMPKMFKAIPTGMAFSQPSRVVLCLRRSIRKSVLHALKKTGRGGQRKPRYNLNSTIRC